MNISIRLVFCLLAGLFAAGQAAAGKMAVNGLRCEYRANPQGIDVRQPRLSWVIEADGRAQAQSAFELGSGRTEQSYGIPSAIHIPLTEEHPGQY